MYVNTLGIVCCHLKINDVNQYFCSAISNRHYYRKAHLSRVQTTFSPGFPTGIAHPGQMCLWLLSRPLFNRDKCNFSKQKKFSSPAPEEPASTNPKIGPKLQYRNPDLIHNTLHITYQDLIHTSKKAQDLIHNT